MKINCGMLCKMQKKSRDKLCFNNKLLVVDNYYELDI